MKKLIERLINTAISQNVQGIANPIWVPDAQVPALQEAAKKGIKIMMYNSGADSNPCTNSNTGNR